MIGLLKDYIAQLEQSNGEQQQGTANRHSYYMPADSVAPEEWAEFDNVYQVHCPKVNKLVFVQNQADSRLTLRFSWTT